MTRRARSPRPAAAITPVYEGPDVLGTLLENAGSPCSVDEVAARFTAAIAAGEGRASVIPGLFEEEPRFATPDEARRLYANLFGLWGRIAEGRGPHDDAPEVIPEPPPPPPLPERGTGIGTSPTAEIVDGIWRQLAAAPERELRRLRDRFANTQPELGAWLDELPLSAPAVTPVRELTLDAWAMFDHSFDERLGVAAWKELRELEREPPPLEADHPALAAYVSDQLDDLGDEDPNFGAPERAQVERALAAVAAALASVVGEPS